MYGLLSIEIICQLLEKTIASLLLASFWSAVNHNTSLNHRDFIHHSVCNHLQTFFCHHGSSFIAWSCLRYLRHWNSGLQSCHWKRLHSLFIFSNLGKGNRRTGFREGLFHFKIRENVTLKKSIPVIEAIFRSNSMSRKRLLHSSLVYEWGGSKMCLSVKRSLSLLAGWKNVAGYLPSKPHPFSIIPFVFLPHIVSWQTCC